MKILMVNKFLYPRGGAESYMLKIGAALEGCGHEVEYFGMFDEKNTVGNSAGEYTRNMDFHTSSLSRFLYPLSIIYSVDAKEKIGLVINRFKPDIIHLNNINFQLTPSIIEEAKRRGIKVVQTVHDYQMICPNHLLYNAGEKQVCTKCIGGSKLNCIKGRCIHGSAAKSVIGAAEAWLYRLRGTYKRVDRFILPSSFLEERLLEASRDTYEGKTVVMHNFIEKPRRDDIAESPYPFRYIAFAGRLSEEKGIKILAETARRLSGVQFVVMGTGPEADSFYGLKNVTMTGFITGSELNSVMAGAEAVAAPSVCYENCPLSILEARALGVPAVTVGMGGMAELVTDGVDGILAGEASAEEFTAAVQRLLSDDGQLQKMKENCIEESRSILSPEEYTERLLQIYDEVLRK